jgi:Mn-dependent DtxR family transcriptional regulator
VAINAPAPSPPIDGGTLLEYLILEDLQHPRTITARTPARIADRIGHEPRDVRDACDQLEADGLLERYMGLRLTQAGYARLANLNRRREA